MNNTKVVCDSKNFKPVFLMSKYPYANGNIIGSGVWHLVFCHTWNWVCYSVTESSTDRVSRELTIWRQVGLSVEMVRISNIVSNGSLTCNLQSSVADCHVVIALSSTAYHFLRSESRPASLKDHIELITQWPWVNLMFSLDSQWFKNHC